MKTFVRNTLAVISGFLGGSVVNMTLITLGSYIIPLPVGVDPTDTQSINDSIHLFEGRHFMVPFLSHSLGTLTGVLVTYLIAVSHQSTLAYVNGVLFLAGGIAAALMIPAPIWFIILDILVAYLPMAWVSILFGKRIKSK